MRANFISTAWKGGSGWFVHELAAALARSGVETTLISPAAEPPEREGHLPALSRLFSSRGADGRGNRLSRLGKSLLKIASSLLLSAQARARSPIFLYTHMDWLAAGVLHFLVLRLLAARLIYIVHDATPHARAASKGFSRLERWLLILSYRLPTRLVTLTEAARRELIEQYGVRPAKISVIPHGAYAPARITPLPGTGQILLFGMLRRNKRVAEAILAFAAHGARFPRLRLLIAGQAPKEEADYWADCETLMRSAGQARIATEIGFVEECRVGELIRDSDAILLAYDDFNSQSGVAILACLSERPVIGTNAGGLAELRSHGLEMTPIKRPVSAATIADALEAFSRIPLSALRESAARSRAALVAHLSWDHIAGEYGRLISALSDR